MTSRQRPARERAARALCRFHGNPEDTMFEGRPMWESYLPEVEAVLEALGWRADALTVGTRRGSEADN